MESSSLPFNNVVLPLSRPGSCLVHFLQLAQLVTISVIGLLEHLRFVITTVLSRINWLFCVLSKTNMFFDLISQGTFVSMGVYSDGSYNVPAGLIYSFPVTCRNGEWTIVQGKYISRNQKLYTMFLRES